MDLGPGYFSSFELRSQTLQWIDAAGLALLSPCVGLGQSGDVTIDPLRFLAGCRKGTQNQALSAFLSIVALRMCSFVMFIRDTLCIITLLFYVFCLLVVLFKLSQVIG